MEMLNERRGGSQGNPEGGGGSGVQEEEESAEWYSSTVSNLENSESEVETSWTRTGTEGKEEEIGNMKCNSSKMLNFPH